jgi:hypothetical protein
MPKSGRDWFPAPLAVVVLLGWTFVAAAESTREQLKAGVEQLQRSPNDTALRVRVIKLAQAVKPAPVVPDQAIKYEGRGQFRFKNAKTLQDYAEAAKEYEQAVLSAPWVLGYYLDLCTIYEKTGKFTEANIKLRVAGLEVGIENASPEVVAERNRKEGEELFRKFSGRLYVCSESDFFKMMDGSHRQVRRSYRVRPTGFLEIVEYRTRGEAAFGDADESDHLLTDRNPGGFGIPGGIMMDGSAIRPISSDGWSYHLAGDGSRVIVRSSKGEELWSCYPR